MILSGEEIVGDPGWTFDEKGNVKLTRTILVYTLPGATETEVANWSGLPAWFSANPDYPPASLRNAEVKRFPEGSLESFIVVCHYDSSPYSEGDQGSSPADSSHQLPPAARAVNIRYGDSKFTRPLGPKDEADSLVVNSAGMPFDPPHMLQDAHDLITLSAACAANAISPGIKRDAYMNRLNDAAFTIQGYAYPAEQLKCNSYNITTEYVNASSGYELKLEVVLERNKKGWQPVLIDMGTHTRNTQDGIGVQVQPIVIDGVIVRRPVPLDGAGQVNPQGADVVPLPPFKGYKTNAFDFLFPPGIVIP